MEKSIILWYNETREERIGKVRNLNNRHFCTFFPDTYSGAYYRAKAVTSLSKGELVLPNYLETANRFNKQRRFKNATERFKKSRFNMSDKKPLVKNQNAIITDEKERNYK